MRHRQDRTRRCARCKGFTLVEMLVVIAVLSILAGISIPAYSKYRDSARKSQALVVLRNLQTAVELLGVDTGRWPGPNTAGVIANQEVWDLTTQEAGLMDHNGAFPGWNGPYLHEIPKDPWGNDYFFDPDYRIAGVDHAVVGSFGPNGVGKNIYDADDVVLILPTE